MVVPASAAVVVFGILTWWAAHLPLWGAGDRWVTVALLLFASTLPLVPRVPATRRDLERALSSAMSEGRPTPQLRSALYDRAVAAARLYEKAVVAVVIVLM